jgi:hypothetical protein
VALSSVLTEVSAVGRQHACSAMHTACKLYGKNADMVSGVLYFVFCGCVYVWKCLCACMYVALKEECRHGQCSSVFWFVWMRICVDMLVCLHVCCFVIKNAGMVNRTQDFAVDLYICVKVHVCNHVLSCCQTRRGHVHVQIHTCMHAYPHAHTGGTTRQTCVGAAVRRGEVMYMYIYIHACMLTYMHTQVGLRGKHALELLSDEERSEQPIVRTLAKRALSTIRYLSVCLSICLSVYLSVCLSV